MTKEKLVKLQRYLDEMTARSKSAIPDKHKDHPAQYKAFLAREIAMVQSQLDAAKLDGVK